MVELLAAGIEYVHFWLTLATVLGLSVLRLLTKVVSLIVKNCSSSSVSVAMYVQSLSPIAPLALSVIVNSNGLVIVIAILLEVSFPVNTLPPFFLSRVSKKLPLADSYTMLVIVAGVLTVTLLSSHVTFVI